MLSLKRTIDGATRPKQKNSKIKIYCKFAINRTSSSSIKSNTDVSNEIRTNIATTWHHQNTYRTPTSSPNTGNDQTLNVFSGKICLTKIFDNVDTFFDYATGVYEFSILLLRGKIFRKIDINEVCLHYGNL